MYIEKNIGEFLRELSSKAPTPGGGGASAGVGAYAKELSHKGYMINANLLVI